MENNYFTKLNALDVSKKAEKKKDLTYLSWAWAWAELMKLYPEATYKIHRYEGLPYMADNETGYMVSTEITIEGITREMWLPVMDGSNKAMRSISYKYSTKYGDKTVEKATMFDINKTIMRCLVKNIAMFGLGLYIYAGEDLPEIEENDEDNLELKKNPEEMITDDQSKEIDSLGIDKMKACIFMKVNAINELTKRQAEQIIKMKKGSTNK